MADEKLKKHKSGARISPQGHVLIILNVSEAGQGLIRGEIRGVDVETAERMLERKSCVPYTDEAHKLFTAGKHSVQKEVADQKVQEAEHEDVTAPIPGFEALKAQ